MYFLIAAFRNNVSNVTKIGYEKIVDYTGIERGHIRAALSLLVTHGLLHIDSEASTSSNLGVASLYRLTKLDPYNHNGTTGRQNLAAADDIF
jgi:hypothetical protein